GTICKHIIKDYADKVYLSVSATTRQKKNGEKQGVDYFFLSREEFEQQIKDGNFLEYAEVFGNFYGTPKDKTQQALDKGKIVLLEIDVQGAQQIKKIYPDAQLIFIMPPQNRELKNRILGRGRDNDADIEKRLAGAEVEIAAGWQHYDYVVINDKLETAVDEIKQIINKVIGA
ncbi:MAG: guanylate kinase, partial [Planctomycetes bacterium GWF2_42_9]